MRKFFALTLCGAMAVSLTACGGKASDTTTAAETTAAETTTAAVKAETLTGSAEGYGGQVTATLTVEDGKITDACTRDEFLDKFRENEIDSPWKEPEYGLEHELEISMDIGGGESRMEQGMVLEEEEMEL